ncbi:MAG: histidine phosphatase family protein [Streptosporangiaceae bacterium]|jgi:broad specificity phosphatase PhoE
MVNSTLATRTVWLVRHGESTWNRLGRCQGHNDEAELTDRGQQHAHDVAVTLRDKSVGAIYVSDLRRAVQTATPLAAKHGLPMQADVRLRERCLGVKEGGPLTEVGPDVTGVDGGVVVDPDARPDGGESLRDFYGRAADFSADLAAKIERDGMPPGDVVIVAHGGTLRVLQACLTGLPVERMGWMPVPNGTILRVALTPDGDRRDSARRDHP